MATVEEIRGNIHHNVQPCIGWLRLAIHDGTPMSPTRMQAVVDKLYAALEEADKLSNI